MGKGSFSVTDEASEILSADNHRGSVVLQHLSGGAVFLEFGDGSPTAEEGLTLWLNVPKIVIDDFRSKLSINAVCVSGESATGAYFTE